MIQTVCVYCGSADNIHQDYLTAAFQMGRALAQSGLKIVYGAGKTGLMGAVAEGALNANGQVIGVVPEHLNQPQLIHNHLSRLEVVSNMHLRKARMSELADAFIALPGGYGTFEELFETLTWAQIGLHHKPIGLLNTRDYYAPLLELIHHALAQGFIYAEHKTLLVDASNPSDLLNLLNQFEPPGNIDRWVNRPD